MVEGECDAELVGEWVEKTEGETKGTFLGELVAGQLVLSDTPG